MRPAFQFNRPPTVGVRQSAQFPARVMPSGTRRAAGVPSVAPVGPTRTLMTPTQHFNRSMAHQAARVPRLAGIQQAALAVKTGRGRAR